MSSRFAETLSSLSRTDDAILIDGWSNPEGSLHVLSGAFETPNESILLKLAPPAVDGATDGFAPLPTTPHFAGVSRGKPDLELTSGAEHVTRVLVTTESRFWGSGSTAFTKFASEIRLYLDSGKELTFGGALGDGEESAKALVAPLARALATFLAIPCEGVDTGTPLVEAKSTTALSGATAASAARFSMGFEGEHLVLRDHEHRGPRDGADRYKTIAYVCLIPSLLSLAVFAWGLRVYLADASSGIGLVLGPLSLGVVLGVAAFAFFEVARFANSYSAGSTPLAWFCDDRLVVAPWVSRAGAIDTRPEGRFGAAIRTSEFIGASVREREGVHAVVLETAHGPIEVLETDDPSVAKLFASVAERAVRAVASPEKKRTAMQRAHERRDKRSHAPST